MATTLKRHERSETVELEMLTSAECKRGRFDELLHKPDWVSSLIRELEGEETWETGIESTGSRRRNQGVATNVDVYGHDGDRELAVVQVRRTAFDDRMTWNNTWRDYHLIGRNESGTPWAHPIGSPRRSDEALRTACTAVNWALRWIWDGDDEPDLRQGDVGLWEVRQWPAAASADRADVTPVSASSLGLVEIVLRASHRIRAREIRITSTGIIYASGITSVSHLPREHETIRPLRKCIYRIRAGRRWEPSNRGRASNPTVD